MLKRQSPVEKPAMEILRGMAEIGRCMKCDAHELLDWMSTATNLDHGIASPHLWQCSRCSFDIQYNKVNMEYGV